MVERRSRFVCTRIQGCKRGNRVIDIQTGSASPYKAKSAPATPIEPRFGTTTLVSCRPRKSPSILSVSPLKFWQYTSEAFRSRTQLSQCSTLSFKDIAGGSLPTESLTRLEPESSTLRLNTASPEPDAVIEMTICSFALHLVDSPSELFGLLWELRFVIATLLCMLGQF